MRRPTIELAATPSPSEDGHNGTSGLSAAEVAARIAAGKTNEVTVRTSRTVGDIIRTNTFTVFNGLLTVLFVVIILTGRWQNGLFGGVIIANMAIGISQEARAKRTLDRLAILNEPRASVVRDGSLQTIDIGEIVVDDLIEIRAGDQVPADGEVCEAQGLEVDESLLTGESEPVVKNCGMPVQSGSIAVAGRGRFHVTAVGADAYAARLATDARRFATTHSELTAGTDRILRWISGIMLVVGPILLWSQFHTGENKGWRQAATGTVAALVGMVPEGLVLLTSLAFMIATIALARRHTLVQELQAVEGLARVDVVCLDKTGTLTHGDIEFSQLHVLGGATKLEVESALALFGDGTANNAVANELARAFGTSGWAVTGMVAFSSTRKWASVDTDAHGTWVLGAPEIVLPELPADAREIVASLASDGNRVLLLAHTPRVAPEIDVLPEPLEAVALIVFTERIRDDASATLSYFATEGVTLKVISGDNPRTVGSIAARVGIPGVAGPEDAIDARTLPNDLDEMADIVESHSVFGRVSPQQKRAVVAALQRRGHVVAMTGDGVNDALALKDADIGVAMGSGSPATRAVAQFVLLDNRFAHLPEIVAEGRRVTANIERAASLFLVKNVYSLTLALICAATLAAYPLAPIQLTLVSTLTIGVPGFFLALGPNTRCYQPGFIGRVLRFAVPVGVLIGGSAWAAYRTTKLVDPAGGNAGGRTTAALVVLVCALWTLAALARPVTRWRAGLLACVSTAVAVLVGVPPLGHGVFLLDVTPARVALASGLSVLAAAAIAAMNRIAAVTFDPPTKSKTPVAPTGSRRRN